MSETDSGVVISQNVEANTRYNEGAITDIILTVSMGSEDDKDGSTGEDSNAGNADDGAAGTVAGETGGNSKTSGGLDTVGSSQNDTDSKSGTVKSSDKDYDVKSDGNEQVDFYLDD